MTYGSVCSGIEAATVAWHPLGWKPSFFAEIDKFPSVVLKHHYPAVPNAGDFTTIKDGDYGAIDLLVGGTPCQDFSIAGLRAGVAGERGNLTLEFLRLAKRLRPRWVVWENVPGVLSSTSHIVTHTGELRTGYDGFGERIYRQYIEADETHAFSCFLAGLQELGYGFAYRVLDAQHFGVPQRRRRVFVVGHLGDWRRAAAVLFERHSLSGYPPPRREKGQVSATIPARRSGGGGFDGDAFFGEKLGLEDQHIRGGQVYSSTGDVSHCLNAGGMGRQDFETETLLAVGGFPDPAHTILAKANDSCDTSLDTYVTHSLRSEGFDASEDGTGRGTPLIPVGVDGVRIGMAIRRLTPRECERLQGFPDDYTKISDKTADGPRYKALGNSMAVPVMRWIGERIQMVEEISAKTGEVFG